MDSNDGLFVGSKFQQSRISLKLHGEAGGRENLRVERDSSINTVQHPIFLKHIIFMVQILENFARRKGNLSVVGVADQVCKHGIVPV